MQDVLNTKGILRLVQSIPSKKAEPFKIWLHKSEVKDLMKLPTHTKSRKLYENKNLDLAIFLQ